MFCNDLSFASSISLLQVKIFQSRSQSCGTKNLDECWVGSLHTIYNMLSFRMFRNPCPEVSYYRSSQDGSESPGHADLETHMSYGVEAPIEQAVYSTVKLPAALFLLPYLNRLRSLCVHTWKVAGLQQPASPLLVAEDRMCDIQCEPCGTIWTRKNESCP